MGFHTPNGQAYPGTQADPDLPNAVTVNASGILAVAVDQANANPNVTPVADANPTPNYLRNPVILSGGAIAATGYEVSFGAATGTDSNGNPISTNPQGVPISTLVTRKIRRQLHRLRRQCIRGHGL